MGTATVNFCWACLGTGHVCENHPTQPWSGISGAMSSCGCGAGIPCLRCTKPIPHDGTHSITEAFVSHGHDSVS